MERFLVVVVCVHLIQCCVLRFYYDETIREMTASAFQKTKRKRKNAHNGLKSLLALTTEDLS